MKLQVIIDVEQEYLEECGSDELNEWIDNIEYDLQYFNGLTIFDQIHNVEIKYD